MSTFWFNEPRARAGAATVGVVVLIAAVGVVVQAATATGTGTGPVPGQRTDVESYRMARSLAIRGEADRAFELLRAELERGFDTGVVLGDVAWTSLRRDPRLKDLIRQFAAATSTAIAPSDEPGARITLEVEVAGGDGAPVAGALVYAYQTDSQGRYAPPPGGADNPRLWAYARSDNAGRLRLDTIRPGAYPDGVTPAHVHLEIEAEGFEVLFDDDPLLDVTARHNANRRGWPVAHAAGTPATAAVRVTLPPRG